MLASVCALAFCLFLWPAVVTFNPGDWPSPNQYPHLAPSANACGPVGAWLAYQLRYYLGSGTYALLALVTLAAAGAATQSLRRIPRGPKPAASWERAFGLVLFVVCTSASAHLISEPGTGLLPVGNGGVIGYALGECLRHNLDRVGTLIVLVCSLFVGLLFVTEGSVLEFPSVIRRIGQLAAVVLRRGSAQADAGGSASLLTSALGRQPLPAGDGVTTDESAALLGMRKRSKLRIQSGRAEDSGKQDRTALPQLEDDDNYAAADDSTLVSKAKKGRKAAKAGAGPVIRFPSRPQTSREAYPRQIENWTLPSLMLLREPEYGFSAQQELAVRRQAQVLEQTLQEFRLDARVVEIDTGPVITMFELQLSAGIKVSQIVRLSNDIARALRAHAIRVVAPISGKNTVGIEVPNIEKERVRLHELMTLAGKRASAMALPLFLGKDAGGKPLVTDLTRMPHLLIAGTTGSGKSVSLNAITLSLLMTKRPDHVKLILIDPKMVEMSQFKDVPHLMCPIVTDLARAEKILAWAVTKMDERYELLAEARVKNITGYNSLGADGIYARLGPRTREEKARIVTHLPYIVIIIDELADLMMTAAREVEHHLSRLAQKSRAVGVHIIVATQRPEAKVVTGLVKSNLPCRVCFRVASRVDSRIVLDQNGGEVLLGQGDMLFLPPGSHKLIRAQGTFLEDSEIHAVLDDLNSRAKPEFHPELVRLKTPGVVDSDGSADPLFNEAVRIILESKRGSVSLLQRRLTVGYSRASRLIDQMAGAGIVGEYKGSQAREVLMTVEEWESLEERIAADREEGYEADQDDPPRRDDTPWQETHADRP